jgi:hypothetical protein
VYKKGISIILVMLMVLGGLNGLVTGGIGVESDPYQIATAIQLDVPLSV